MHERVCARAFDKPAMYVMFMCRALSLWFFLKGKQDNKDTKVV